MTPAGLPSGIPGNALLIDGAMQQAPQPGRQFMSDFFLKKQKVMLALTSVRGKKLR